MKLLLLDEYLYVLKWLSTIIGPFRSRAKFVFSHLKIDEIDCRKTAILQKCCFLSIPLVQPIIKHFFVHWQHVPCQK